MTGREGRDVKRAGPTPQAAAEVLEGHLSTTTSQAPQPRAPEAGRGAHIISGYESLQGFCPSGRDGRSLEK